MGYAETSRQKDFDQHASKIRLGLQNLTGEDAKRAIWELFQNAVDLTDKCHIKISRTSDGLNFEHNGEHFNEDSFASLIKQVTNKTPGTTEEQVGQYGTGFITTHIYGKEIKLTGYVKVEDGYIPIKNFVIDRKEEPEKPLFRMIMDQDDAAGILISSAVDKTPTADENVFTGFHYQAEQHNFDSIDAAIKYLDHIIPLVFVFNDRLLVVEVNDGNSSTVYRRKEPDAQKGYSIVHISKNDADISFVCLFSPDERKKFRIILPYTEDFRAKKIDDFPKLFLFYPLIGTENNGINFIIHNHQFFPKEKRDSIFLEFGNKDIAENVKKNRDIVTASFNMVLDFLRNNSAKIIDGLAIAKVNTAKLNDDAAPDFWEDEKKRFVQELSGIDLINTNDGKTISISTGVFFHFELLHDADFLKSIYAVASQFWDNLPVYDEVFQWSILVQSWNEPKGTIIGVKDILEQVREAGQLSKISNVEHYKQFLKYVLNHSKADWFDSYAILPNIYGDFQTFSNLKEPISIDPILMEVAEALFKNVTERFIDPAFIFNRVFSKYERVDYKGDISSKAVSVSEEIEKNTEVDFSKIEALLRFCSINTTTDLVKQFYEHFAKFYEISSPIVSVEDHVKDFDFRSPMKAIFKFFIFDVTKRGVEWLKENVKVLIDGHKIVYQNDDFKRTLLHELRAYPNQNFELCSQKSIKVDKRIPPKLKEIYLEVMKIDLKNQLALLEIGEFMHEPENLKPDQVGSELEKVFNNDKIKYTEIVSNPYKDIIISIVELITNAELPWNDWFSTLNSYKLQILVGKIIEPSLRTSMFSILTKDDKTIGLLGVLAGKEHLEKIIELGEEAFWTQQQKDANFQYLHFIGTHLEDVLQNHLSNVIEGKIAVPKNVQNGQDLIITIDNKPVYYIEVKSRWNTDSKVRMSKNQTIQAYKEQLRYSLCIIEMSQYKEPDRFNVQEISKIQHVIKFVTNIGTKVGHLIDVFEQSDKQEEVRLDGDFRTAIPQKLIDSGYTLGRFEKFIVDLIKEKHLEFVKQPIADLIA